jgi:cysteine desulfurase
MDSAVIYLDHAATTPMRPQVWEAMEPLASLFYGNPSGSHHVSRQAKNLLEEARERAAAVIGARPLEVVFTGGGTESDNLAIKGAAFASTERRRVVTVATEHEAVLESVHFLARLGYPVEILGVDETGLVDPAELAAAVNEHTAIVSLMAANNETGTIQPVRKTAEAVRGVDSAVLVHTDAVQAFNSETVDVEELGVDMLSLAAHKFGGPKGVGLLYVRSGTNLEPVLHGGGQELGRRSGTHNVAGALGMAVAMELAAADRPRFRESVSQGRRRFEAAIGSLAVRTVPHDITLVQHSHLRFPGASQETTLVRLDRAGVAASVGSACQSGAAQVSHVLTAMGIGEGQARESLRFTLGWTTTPDEAEEAGRLVRNALGGGV